MTSKKPLALAVAGVVLLTACSALENYRFGDATRTALSAAEKVIALKAQYCASENAEAREVLLHAIRLVEPGYKGVCNALTL